VVARDPPTLTALGQPTTSTPIGSPALSSGSNRTAVGRPASFHISVLENCDSQSSAKSSERPVRNASRTPERSSGPISITGASMPAIEVEREEWEEDSTERLGQALEKLDERSRSILKRRWMTEDKATLHELADEYGISAERVRQVESNAISKLKGMMAAA